jgi:transposase-like protein
MRRRYTPEEKQQFWERVQAGASIREAAIQQGIAPSLGYHWAQKARSASRPKFARLVRATTAPTLIAVQVGPATVRVETGFDAELLRAVVSALAAGQK